MAEQFPPLCYIAGVSFGGILALEISRIVQPAGCILIASVTGPDELPPWFRVWRRLGGRNCSSILNIIGNAAAIVPKIHSNQFNDTGNKLSGVAGVWHRWATSPSWTGIPTRYQFRTPLLHIHGDADSTFPIRYTKPNVVVANGRHSLPISILSKRKCHSCLHKSGITIACTGVAVASIC